MEKNIRDYIHHHLGCECEIDGLNGIYKLTGVSYDGTQNLWWAYFDGSEVSYALFEDVKLILRRLSDMTEEEAKEVAYCAGINASGHDVLLVDKNNPKQWIVWNSTDYYDIDDAENNDGIIIIDFTHPFGIYKGYENESYPVPEFLDQANVMRFLLLRGFDLFELIDSNLAIDRATLKENTK
jgi:hypothetical protein